MLLPNFRKRNTLLEDPKISLSVTSSHEDGNGYGALENDADRRNPVHSEMNLLIPLYSSQTPYGNGTDSNAGSRG
jgi:hypothetical protein